MEQNVLNFCKNKFSSNSFIEDRLVTTLMFNGKKKVSKKLLFILHKHLSKNNNKKSINILICSLINCLPVLSTKRLRNKNRRKSIDKYVPFFVQSNQRTDLAIKMLLNKSQLKQLRSLKSEALCQHVLNWSKIDNTSLKIKEAKSNIIFANKKFANYRWF